MVDLEVGKKYRVRHRSETQKKDRESVMVFLDEDNSNYIFSARPVAGTQNLPKEWVLKVEPVPEVSEVCINKVLPD